MKILNKILGAGILVFMLMLAAPLKSAAQNDYISEQDFYDELEPYGTWVYDQQYGDVWIPDVEPDFRPYATRGHWVLTEYGNTWVSDYPWGWATFHYGRWIFDDYYGWEWVPGYEWAPAWVSWRQGGGYYGWAPLSPGIDINVSFGGSYNVPDYYWAFAPQAYINSPYIYNYYVPQTRVVNIIRRSTVVRNTFVRGGVNYIAGPRASDIQRYTGRRPVVYGINEVRRPGTITVRNNEVNIFRPSIRRGSNARPSRVVDADAYRQQNPNFGIARRGQNGIAGYDKSNAARLAAVARSANSNRDVVQVNRPDGNGSGSNEGRRPNRGDNANSDQGRPVGQSNQPAFTPNRNRSQDAQSRDLNQRAEQLKGQQQAVRQQRRQEWIREGQEQSVGRSAQTPSIYGQTPLQQQEMALRDQKRQLQRDQERAQREQQQQQAQNAARDQQRLGQQQVEQAQREQQRQAQQQQRQGRQQVDQVQLEQQRQVQQAAQHQQRQVEQAAQQQQRQAQQQAEQAQREQQRQVQQIAQQQQRQAQQQAEQAQREQQRQAQQAAQQQQKQAEQQAQQAQREQQRQAQQAVQQQRQAQQAAQQQQQEAQRAQQTQQQQQQQRGGQRRPGGR